MIELEWSRLFHAMFSLFSFLSRIIGVIDWITFLINLVYF